MAENVKQGNSGKRTWVAPEVIAMSDKGPSQKLNFEIAERSRSGISYAPS